jgi:Tol biopolymer transport system component
LATSVADASPTHGQLATRFLIMVEKEDASPEPVLERVDRSGRVQAVYDHVIPGRGFLRAARWSPDGTRLAWTTDAGVYVENSDGSARRLLVPTSDLCTTSCSYANFAWSPDSRSLLVGGVGEQTNALLLVSVASSSLTHAAPTLPFANYTALGFAPDGRSFVYTRLIGNPGHASCCYLDVRVASTDGRTTRVAYRFSSWRYEGSFPTLAPNGRSIAFVYPVQILHTRRGANVLRVVDLRTGKTHDIGGFEPTFAQAWSPDSRRIAFVNLRKPDWRVETVAASGGPTHSIGPGVSVSWQHDGELLVIRGTHQEQVWASANGKPEQFLFRTPHNLSVASIDTR